MRFSDISNHWGEKYIVDAANKGLVSGVGNGLYEPQRNATRAEFVQMVVNVLQLPEASENTKAYSDVNKTHWAYENIMKAKEYGILDDFTGMAFVPDELIKREEMAAILAKAIACENKAVRVEYLDLSQKFSDVNELNPSFDNSVQTVVNSGIMSGMGDGADEFG